jgi:hypothetical protein
MHAPVNTYRAPVSENIMRTKARNIDTCTGAYYYSGNVTNFDIVELLLEKMTIKCPSDHIGNTMLT